MISRDVYPRTMSQLGGRPCSIVSFVPSGVRFVFVLHKGRTSAMRTKWSCCAAFPQSNSVWSACVCVSQRDKPVRTAGLNAAFCVWPSAGLSALSAGGRKRPKLRPHSDFYFFYFSPPLRPEKRMNSQLETKCNKRNPNAWHMTRSRIRYVVITPPVYVLGVR